MTPQRLAEIRRNVDNQNGCSTNDLYDAAEELLVEVDALQGKLQASNIEALIWRMAAWRRARQRPAPVMSQAIRVETIPCPLCEGLEAHVVAMCQKCNGAQTLQRLVELGYGI